LHVILGKKEKVQRADEVLEAGRGGGKRGGERESIVKLFHGVEPRVKIPPGFLSPDSGKKKKKKKEGEGGARRGFDVLPYHPGRAIRREEIRVEDNFSGGGEKKKRGGNAQPSSPECVLNAAQKGKKKGEEENQ